jgi:hypothetical protein
MLILWLRHFYLFFPDLFLFLVMAGVDVSDTGEIRMTSIKDGDVSDNRGYGVACVKRQESLTMQEVVW